MSRVAPVGLDYCGSPFVVQEANEIGGGAEYLGGAKAMGYRDSPDVRQQGLFGMQLAPAHGEKRPVTLQSNSPSQHYGMLFDCDKSVGAVSLVLTARPDLLRQFFDEVFKPAGRNAFDVLNAGAEVRQRVDGVIRPVKADIVAMMQCHAGTNNGGHNPHLHVTAWRQGVTADGKALSWANPEMTFFKNFKHADDAFQATVAAKLETVFGLEVTLVKGKVQVLGVPEELLEKMGSRRKEMVAHLEKLGIPVTRKSLDVAAVATRVEKQAFQLDERLRYWAGQAAAALEEAREAGKTVPPAIEKLARNEKTQTTNEKGGATDTEDRTGRQDRRHKKARPERADQGQTAGEGRDQASHKTRFSAGPEAKEKAKPRWRPTLTDHLHALLPELILEVGKTMGLVARKALFKRKDIVQIRDGVTFLEETRVKTVKEAARYARRELRKQAVDDWNAVKAMGNLVAMAARLYREGKKPKLTFQKGTVIVIGAKAFKALTPEQQKQLADRAVKNGWTLKAVGEKTEAKLQQQMKAAIRRHLRRERGERREDGQQRQY